MKRLLKTTQYVIGCYSTRTIAFECSSLEAMEELRNFYAVAQGVVPHPSLCVYTRLEWLSGCTTELVTKLSNLLVDFVGERLQDFNSGIHTSDMGQRPNDDGLRCQQAESWNHRSWILQTAQRASKGISCHS